MTLSFIFNKRTAYQVLNTVYFLQGKFHPFFIEYYKNQRKFMKIVGMWPFADSRSAWFRRRAIALMLDAYTCVVIWGIIGKVIKSDDLILQLELISSALTYFMAMIKSWVTIIGQKQLRQIFFLIDDLYSNAPIEQNEHIKELLQDVTDHLNKVYKYILVSGWGAFVFYVGPIFITYYLKREWHYIHDSYFVGVENNSLLFWITLLMQVIVAARAVMTFFYDSLFPAFILMICTRIDVLLETMKLSALKVRTVDKSNLFKKGIEYHKKITR